MLIYGGKEGPRRLLSLTAFLPRMPDSFSGTLPAGLRNLINNHHSSLWVIRVCSLSTRPSADKGLESRGLGALLRGPWWRGPCCPFLDHTQCWEETSVDCVPSAWFCKGTFLPASLPSASLLLASLLASLFPASPSCLRKGLLTFSGNNKGQLIEHLASQGRSKKQLRGLPALLIITL